MSSEIAPYRPLELMMDEKITKFDFTDFIGVWENFAPKPFCDNLINFFDNMYSKTGQFINQENYDEEDIKPMRGDQQYNGSMNRKDISFMMNYVDEEYTYQINQFLKSCVMHYINEYSQLRNLKMISSDIKFQRTSPGGGYHVWHYENASPYFSQRELTWMIYLNDIPDGEGETEFLYQRRRIKPTKGTVVIFPAGMTHVHKGNTVFTTNKYILTGWYIKAG